VSDQRPPAPPQRQGFFAQFRGMPWWQILLIVLPLSLIGVGGLVGGVLGALAALGNTYVARSTLSTTMKVLVMLGLLVAAWLVWLVLALAISAALRSATSS
jgi:hypothetical protein